MAIDKPGPEMTELDLDETENQLEDLETKISDFLAEYFKNIPFNQRRYRMSDTDLGLQILETDQIAYGLSDDDLDDLIHRNFIIESAKKVDEDTIEFTLSLMREGATMKKMRLFGRSAHEVLGK